MDEHIITFRKQLESRLDPMRYEHSLSVSFTSVALAMRYGYDIHKAEIAGLLHDCAKRFSDSVLIAKCEKHGIPLAEDELRAPAVIHAIYGAWIAEHKFGIQDEEILSAIRCHTTGKPAMGMLDKILYVADYIEPRREKAGNLPEMRYLAFQDLDQAVYALLSSSLSYLGKKGGNVAGMTRQAFMYYEEEARAAQCQSGQKGGE